MASSLRINPDVCKTWERSGKSDFMKLFKGSSATDDLWAPSTKPIRQALCELFWCVVRGHLKLEHAVSAIREVEKIHRELPSLLADILYIIDVETSCVEDKLQRDRFLSLVTEMMGIIPEAILKERLDQDMLESVGLIQSKQQFQQKYVKTKTKLYYKQQKFNLLREESEGYGKLMTELNQEISSRITCTQVLESIKSLIGCFDLDPNRVLDIMLESFECRPEHYAFYIPVFRAYMTEQKTLCHILGFKFHFYQSATEETPFSLYRVTALLVKHGLVDLESMYYHLSPADINIVEFHQRELLEAKQQARKLNVAVVSDKGNDSQNRENDSDTKLDLKENNQKLGLCKALLIIGDWEHAKEIVDKLPNFFVTSHRDTAEALTALIHALIDPLYMENTGLPSTVLKKNCKVRSQNLSLEKIHTFAQLNNRIFPMLSCLGPHAAYDVVLLVKLIRLGKMFMKKRLDGGIRPDDESAYCGFLTVLDEVLLPSITQLPCNCCLSEELWSLLKLYPYELRYRLYGHWKNDTYNQHAKMIEARVQCLEKARYIMKRLSKENVKPSGRQLGKLSHSNPGVLFEYVLAQIQKYDNFIGPVVDSLKYLTSLSYDVLAYCIIEAVANPDKQRLKHDDTNISLWLQSLASFAGSICRKYQVELAGLMQYVANQLKAGKSFDLLLLREVVQKMAGIEISEEITDDQLEAMAGGELLRQEGGYFAQVRNTKKSSTRLKEALLEQDLALSLCLLMAQQKDGVIFQEGTERHLKLTGKLYDQCQDTLVQFGSFLSMQLSTEEFVKKLPPINVLIGTYHVPHDAAFFLSRPLYSYAINAKFEELKKQDRSKQLSPSSQNKMLKYVEASKSVMAPLIDLVCPLYPSKVWDDLSSHFYITFWSLSMYDLHVPRAAYEKQTQLLKTQMSAIEDNDLPQSKKKKEKERCSTLTDKLNEEERKQMDHVQHVMMRLTQEKELWFLSRSTKNEMITQFLQLCIFPRCCFTASDALFCAKFIYILHELRTPNFSTLICYDRILCDVTYTVTSCTENEAHRYGRFLCAAMETIMKWHSDKTIYEKECAKYPGFVTVFRKGTDSNNMADHLDYENYRHVCHKWHFRITKAMVACLESGNYIQIRNSLIILTKILPHYPKIMQFGQALERRVNRIRQDEKEKRPDIYALAMGYSGQLKSKKPLWVPENEFHCKAKDKDNKMVRLPELMHQKNQNKNNYHGQKQDISSFPAKEQLFSKKVAEAKPKENRDGKEKKTEKKLERKEVILEKSKTSSLLDGKKSDTEKKTVFNSALREEKVNPLKDKLGKEKSPEKNSDKENRHKEEKRHSKGHEEKMRKEEQEEKVKDSSHYKDKESRHMERVSGVVSSGSHRRSAESSPKIPEDRDPKRRKMESATSSSSKEGGGHHSSESREKTRQSPGEKEREHHEEKKREKKRDLSSDRSNMETSKKRKGEDKSGNKVNGESENPRQSSISKEKERGEKKQLAKYESMEKGSNSKRDLREEEYREKSKEKERLKRLEKEKLKKMKK